MELERLENLQIELSKRLHIPLGDAGFRPKPGDLLVSLDVQYTDSAAFVAMDTLRWQSSGHKLYVCELPAAVEYVPGFFAFREGPVLKAALDLLISSIGMKPDFLLVDGHGTAHPRKFGVACWLGLEMGIPALGCAKETLVRYSGVLQAAAGSWLPVEVEGETVGYVLRVVDGIRPVFVSAGHLISLQTSASIIFELTGEHRICEPLRRADQACRAYARGETGKDVGVLGV